MQAEEIAGHALIGTHRDELDIRSTATICVNSARPANSEVLLLLQLANITVYNATRGEYPLFLLDDIDAELDYAARIGQLLEYLEGKTQTFVTTSKGQFCPKFVSIRLFSKLQTA